MEYKKNNHLPQQFSFAKDLSGRYLFVSENVAEVAGFDSPAQMIGLRDSDLIWKDQTEDYRQADTRVFRGEVLVNHAHFIRFCQNPDKLRLGLNTKTALRDKQNNIIGVIGATLDVTDHYIFQKPGSFDATGKKFLFSGELAGLVLSKKQIVMLNYVIRGYSAADIAQLLNRSKRTIEGHIEHLKNKLQCNSKAEIIRWAVTSGLMNSIGQGA
jgi:DNA-binding CsgD family transcriptional regulator